MNLTIKKINRFTRALPVVLSLASVIGCQQTSNETVPSNTVSKSSELNFSITEGNAYNQFYRQGNVAAHTLFSAGHTPRIVVAFPAGNSGVSLWFDKTEQRITWQQQGQTIAAHDKTADGDALHGVKMHYKTNAKNLVLEAPVLGSVRVIRDFAYRHQVPNEMVTQQDIQGNTITWYRDRLDGQGGYKLTVQVNHGDIKLDSQSKVHFMSTGATDMTFSLIALTGDKPLTPITRDNLLRTVPQGQDLTADVLSYLSYEEKMLAGSWRFQTYFGRDTLLSLAMLMPNLQNNAIEAGLSSAIIRLSPTGEVAHEEDVGEFALLRHQREQKVTDAKPIFDYKMLDDNYLLSAIVAQYLLDSQIDRNQAKAFLNRTDATGTRYGELLAHNFDYVLKNSKAYAQNPNINNLIRLKEGEHFGEWRDSHEGLAYGRIPYNVNAVFVPAALNAIVQLKQSGLFDQVLKQLDIQVENKELAHRASIWKQSAQHFKVSFDAQQSKQKQMRYIKHRGLDYVFSQQASNAQATSFYAVSLEEDGTPIPVINSDFGFALLFTKPTLEQLDFAVESILSPYPQGLLSPIGMMVASAAYAEPKLYSHVTKNHYHGEVVWSWQQALFAAGLNKQLARNDLPMPLRNRLETYKDKLWTVIKATQAVKQAELWTWALNDKNMQIQPFGQQSSDKTESNAAQLWSTVYLSIIKGG